MIWSDGDRFENSRKKVLCLELSSLLEELLKIEIQVYLTIESKVLLARSLLSRLSLLVDL